MINYYQRFKSLEERFWEKVDIQKQENCWNWVASKYSKGYGIFVNNSHHIGAHRMSWILSHGEIPEGMFVCHKCDNTSCVNPSHLFLGTNQDNMTDMVQKKRSYNKSGQFNPNVKLSIDDVKKIYLFSSLGYSQRKLAKIFNVAHVQIGKIIRRESWNSVWREVNG